MGAEWEQEGPIVSGFRRQIACFTGKIHTVEFALGVIGTNVHWGAPRNPWDAKNHRVSGGSTSGAGRILHEGAALVALGSDAGGSIRIPASTYGMCRAAYEHRPVPGGWFHALGSEPRYSWLGH